ncbi:MAG TPA: hypothetical protein VF257_01650 [Solirubrobacteraceae bacterium]
MTITRAQRYAIYEMVINHLTAIGDVWLGVHGRDFADAKRLRRKFAEDLRLLQDLGWAETIDQETVTLTMPPGELTRTLPRRSTVAKALAALERAGMDRGHRGGRDGSDRRPDGQPRIEQATGAQGRGSSNRSERAR